jgi:hypothetical protein
MEDSNEQLQELSALIKETGEKLTEESYFKFCDFLDSMGNVRFPLEMWIGFVQAMADASGYYVTLKAAILELTGDEPETYRAVGQREVASGEPRVFEQL